MTTETAVQSAAEESRTDRWYAASAEEVTTRIGVDPAAGLSAQPAAGLLERDGPNALPAEKTVPGWRRCSRPRRLADVLGESPLLALVVRYSAQLFGKYEVSRDSLERTHGIHRSLSADAVTRVSTGSATMEVAADTEHAELLPGAFRTPVGAADGARSTPTGLAARREQL